MLQGHQIIDADSHVTEPIEMWAEYLEPAFQSYAPYRDLPITEEGVIKIAPFSSPYREMKIEGEKIYQKISDVIWAEGANATLQYWDKYGSIGYDPESHIKAMKRIGIDISCLYPTMGLWLLAIDSMKPELAAALTRAYNNWLWDFCSYDREKLRGVGAISRHHPEAMVSELRRIAEFGWKAVFLRPNPVQGQLLSDPAYEAFWTECEKLGIGISLHEGTHGRLPATGSDRFNTRFAMHACSHPMEQMMALLALIEGGVLEHHPCLKVAFLESGCGWLPYWLWRLDEEYEQLSWEVDENVKLKPSDYFRRQCFIAIEPSEPHLSNIINYIGSDNLLFGSDYPHIDHKPDVLNQVIRLQESLSKQILQKILWDNPMSFYGLN